MKVRWPRSHWRRAATVVATLLVGVWAAPGRAQSQASRIAPLTEREKVIHLLSRATYGVRTQDVAEVARIGRDAWVERQLHLTAEDIAAADVAPSTTALPRVATVPRPSLSAGGFEYLSVAAAVVEKMERVTASPRQLEEVMTDFWFNHFNVDGRRAGRLLTGYEDAAIRKHVFGRFEDMLLATARHPAMLLYLDNYLSGRVEYSSGVVGSASVTPGKLNENYARELLELHTLGVDGGYTQEDVIEVARAFSGWTLPMLAPMNGLPIPQPTFLFEQSWHDAGEKRVLGQVLPAGRGQEDGIDVIHLLAHHPSTARHLASKLVRHFVSDEPRPALEEHLARVFLEADGDLEAVTRALFTAPEFYAPANYRAKVRRPFEYVAAAVRVSDGYLDRVPGPLRPGMVSLESIRLLPFMTNLAALGQVPYAEPSPTGYPTTAQEWVSGAAMLERLNFASDLTEGRIEGAWVDAFWALRRAAELAGLQLLPMATATPARHALVARAIVSRVLPGARTAEAAALESAIAADLASATIVEGATETMLVMRALTIALGSPAFQRY